jgi:hypothetical protein
MKQGDIYRVKLDPAPHSEIGKTGPDPLGVSEEMGSVHKSCNIGCRMG